MLMLSDPILPLFHCCSAEPFRMPSLYRILSCCCWVDAVERRGRNKKNTHSQIHRNWKLYIRIVNHVNFWCALFVEWLAMWCEQYVQKKGNVRLSDVRALYALKKENMNKREEKTERKRKGYIANIQRLTGIVILSISEILEKRHQNDWHWIID